MAPPTVRKRDAPDIPASDSDANPSKRLQRSLPGPKKGKRPSFIDSDEMVEVNVQRKDEMKKFLVHKEFICYHSPFFDVAFNGKFQEGISRVLNLEHTAPRTFAMFVEWLYSQKVTVDVEWSPSVLGDLADLWILADRLLVPKLQKEALVAYGENRVALNKRPRREVEHTSREPAQVLIIAYLVLSSLADYKIYPGISFVSKITPKSCSLILYCSQRRRTTANGRGSRERN
ncbi:hypothetical protein LSUE1_G009222 [Lachnellula suecica]|uniref:BTB domain-containing protein n=1 Tax=Lachnellula suecica TaxID=602035 RepID=A0A8T9BVM9_9HELO|nr:hypothetical protein LSUE1_G009222 [Lachnellula suecica]